MRHNAMFEVFFTVIIFFTFVGRSFCAQLGADRIVAIVNNKIVTESEVEELLAVYYMQISSKYSSSRLEEEMKKAEAGALNRLIEDKLILEEAVKEGVQVEEKAIDERLSETKKGFESNSEFEVALGEQGLTVADLKNKLKEQYMMSALIELKVKRYIRVTPVEITAYYQANSDEFNSPESREVDSIFCASEDKAKEALALIMEGNDFNEVKSRFSSVSALGLVKKGELIKEIDEAIFSLEDKGISGIVNANNGFYIFKLLKKFPAEIAALSSVESKIKDKIFKQKMDKGFKDFIGTLRKNAYIMIK